MMPKARVSKELRSPRQLTDADWARLREEGREIAKALDERFRRMETLTPADLAISIT